MVQQLLRLVVFAVEQSSPQCAEFIYPGASSTPHTYRLPDDTPPSMVIHGMNICEIEG
jgi:hypothetical protein